MPAAYAHYRFGQDVLNALPGKYRERLKQEEDLFNIGVQGPDLLFYYKPFSHHPLHAEGGRMHRLTGRDYFTAAGRIFLDEGCRKADYAYLCGFLCHFALDRKCHGYINAVEEEGRVSHAEIESEFDRVLLLEDGRSPVCTNLAAQVHASRRAAEVISPYFPGACTKEILAGMRSFWRFNWLLTLPGRLGYRRVDRLLRRLPSYGFIHGHMINLDPDPLCEQSSRELRQRYEDAVGEACLLIRSLLPAVRGRKQWPPLMDFDFEGNGGAASCI